MLQFACHAGRWQRTHLDALLTLLIMSVILPPLLCNNHKSIPCTYHVHINPDCNTRFAKCYIQTIEVKVRIQTKSGRRMKNKYGHTQWWTSHFFSPRSFFFSFSRTALFCTFLYIKLVHKCTTAKDPSPLKFCIKTAHLFVLNCVS